ncbi:hypothetical protein [Pelagicoccus mobilis]|uniref:Uncharacterized protein n=1 Tax=Pelagicoccus mobilis TaxID=415221 RepID=A0A934VU26_9BACT|nr:hypothetical protein [Pelagicoccus mobilis]MBK1880328.1 hypothetical protein [Pelagicoccus mobilis]
MNSNKYQELLVRRAVKAANKKNRNSEENIDLQALRELKVATASPLSRIFVGGLGSTFLGTTIYALATEGFSWLLTLLAIPGIYFLVVAIRGRKKRVSEIEDAVDFIDVGGNLVEAIIENVDFSIDL